MRVNVYSQELTPEVVRVEKVSNTGITYAAAQLVLHSSPMLHHPPEDDDRSAVTFWLPSSEHRREEMAQAFERIASIFRVQLKKYGPANYVLRCCLCNRADWDLTHRGSTCSFPQPSGETCKGVME